MKNEDNNEPIRFSNEISDGLSNDRVDREAGIIRGISVMSRGDARGKKVWIDSTLIRQLAQFGKEAGDDGVKAHLTHDHVETGEGLTSLLGRMTNFSVVGDGEKVKADLSFVKSAFSSPDGNLAEFAMDVAEDAHRFAGMSILALPDKDAMFEFIEDNGGISFKSPDSENKNNFPHFRARALKSIDLTGSPSANESGLFSSVNSLGREKEAVILYETEVQKMDPTKEDAAPKKEAVEETQSQTTPDVAENFSATDERTRILAIQKEALEQGQFAIGEKCVTDGVTFSEALSVINRAASFANKEALSEIKAKQKEILFALKDARIPIGANAEDNDVGKKTPKTKEQKKGSEVSIEDAEKFQTENPGVSFSDAMTALSEKASARKEN